MFNGFGGITTGLVLFGAIWLVAWLRTKGTSFEFDPQREKGAFEKILTPYLDLSKFILGLASGSIVLLVGSSAFHSSQHLLESFASPLFLLGLSVLYGVFFHDLPDIELRTIPRTGGLHFLQQVQIYEKFRFRLQCDFLLLHRLRLADLHRDKVSQTPGSASIFCAEQAQ